MGVARAIVAHVMLLLLLCGVANATELEAWSYYPSPPFRMAIAPDAGLTQDVVNALNKMLQGKYEIRLRLLPRARIDNMLECGVRGFVIFAPSVIMGGPDGGRYLWTQALLQDSQQLVSVRARSFEYAGPESLFALRFGAIQGHVYPAIDREVRENRIVPYLAKTEEALVQMLLSGRADVITLPDTIVQFFAKHDAAFDAARYTSRKHFGAFTRHMLFQRGMEKECADMSAALQTLMASPEWPVLLGRYGLKPYVPTASGQH